LARFICHILLLLGIFNLGILGMIAYVIAGPDGTAKAVAALGARAGRSVIPYHHQP